MLHLVGYFTSNPYFVFVYVFHPVGTEDVGAGHGANSQVGAMRLAYEPSGQRFTSAVHMVGSDELDGIGEAIGNETVLGVGLGDILAPSSLFPPI